MSQISHFIAFISSDFFLFYDRGNLLRTIDGRLVILDWGMTLNVPNDLQYALLEFIAHINTQDFEALP